MRTILSLAALVTAFHPTSDACGWMPPQVEIRAVTHHIGDRGRSFVIIGEAPAVEPSSWIRVSPQTYDYTSIAELAPEAPRTFTLVGRDGARVVTATHRVVLEDGWQSGNRHRTALEVPAGTFEIALEGKVTSAKWHALEYTYTATEHTDLGLDVTMTQNGFEIASGGKVVSSGVGTVKGFLDAGHQRFIVVETTERDPQVIYFGRAA